MTQPETILRDTALALIPLVGVGAVVFGGWAALGVALAGALLLGNLWVMGRLVRRLTGAMAGRDPVGGFAVAVLVLKFPLLLALVVPLVWAFGGVPVALAFSALVFAVFLRGVALVLQTPPGDDVYDVDAPSGAP